MLWTVLLLAGCFAQDIFAQDISYIETHIHLNAGRWRAASDYEAAAQTALASMQQLGIQKCLLMPPPQGPQNTITFDYKPLVEIVKKYPQYLIFQPEAAR